MQIRRPLRVVYLEWSDAAGASAWKDHAELDTWAESHYLVHHVGYLLHEDDKRLVIAGSWLPETDTRDEQFGDITRIPVTWIRQRRILATVNSDGVAAPTQSTRRRG